MKIKELFDDAKLVEKIQTKLPKLFQIAELESMRGNKIGMEVGTVREKIITALLIYKFGEENVAADIPANKAEIDVFLFGEPISIKTFTGAKPNGIKLVWTVDAQNAVEFSQDYSPGCGMIVVQINWSNGGGFYYIPRDIQERTLTTLGRERYIKLPKAGTNPRGVEMSGLAMETLIKNSDTLRILVNWRKEAVDFNPFERWLELWQAD
ncbi:MAG: ThaI family type II restriction endonuclease [Planctomycetaceae bacterium]|jgi:hypothetical protein|nr:ThaI family type II restriction endonuclease [Planctomycetaceae bacterium]